MNTIYKWLNKNAFDLKMSLFLFLFIFAPPVLQGINLVFLLTIYSACYLIINRKRFIKVLPIKRYIMVFLVLFYIAVIYMSSMMLLSYYVDPINTDNYLKTAYKFFLAGVILPINIFYILGRIKINKSGFWDLIRIVIFAGIIESIFVILMIASPAIRAYLLDVMFTNNNIDVSSIPFWELGRRYFAFSDSVLDTFGLGVGIISVLPIYLFLKNKSKLIFTVPIFLVISIFNSVTGVLIFAIGFTPLISRFIKKINKLYYGRSVLLASLILIIISSVSAYMLMPGRFDWVIRELSALLTFGESTKTQITSFSLVFRPTFWQLPPDLFGLIFGKGHTLYQAAGFDHSDIGYINNIWLGGLFGSIILYGSIVYLFNSAKKASKEKITRMLVFFIFLSFLIFEIKGYGIGYNPGFVVIILIAFGCVSLCLADEAKKNEK